LKVVKELGKEVKVALKGKKRKRDGGSGKIPDVRMDAPKKGSWADGAGNWGRHAKGRVWHVAAGGRDFPKRKGPKEKSRKRRTNFQVRSPNRVKEFAEDRTKKPLVSKTLSLFKAGKTAKLSTFGACESEKGFFRKPGRKLLREPGLYKVGRPRRD